MKMLMVLVMMLSGFTAMAGVKILNNSSAVVGQTAELKCGYGINCAKVSGKQAQVAIKPMLSISTFTSGDTTPAVDAGGPFFRSFADNTVTITDFDGSGIYAGQEIVVQSKGPVTFDVTSSGLICGSTDLATNASGDVSRWV